MDKYPNLYGGVLIDELCTNARWNISVQCAYRYFSYVLHIVGSILGQGLPQMAEKTILSCFMKDLVTYHKRHHHDLGYHDGFNGIDMNNIFVSNGIIKSAYEGHYDFSNLCNCKYTRPIAAADWVEKKIPPSIHKLPTYLNTNKKWTFAVYNCVCSHKFIDLIKYVKSSGLSYWDQVLVVNSLVDDIFSLYPNDNIYNMPRYFGTQNSLKKYSFLKMLPPLLWQDQLYPNHLIMCVEDYNY